MRNVRLQPAVSFLDSRPQAGRDLPAGLRILVVDDDAMLRKALVRVLGDEQQVTTAVDGPSALAEVLAAPFDVVLFDLMMPGMTGAELYEQAQREQPEAARAWVLMTGGATTPETHAFLQEHPWVLRKPFTPEDVRVMVLAVLDGVSAG